MIAELNIYGVFIPALLVWALIALPITAVLKRLLAWTGAYRILWHRPLADISLFIIVLGGVTAAASEWVS